jgi:hypothetical protein
MPTDRTLDPGFCLIEQPFGRTAVPYFSVLCERSEKSTILGCLG